MDYEDRYEEDVIEHDDRGHGNYNEEVVPVKDWLISFIIASIPLVGLVMIFVLAFSDNTNKNMSNFFKANLIMLLIMAVLTVVLWITILGAIFTLFGIFM